MHPFAREARSVVRLALPVVATQLGSMLLLVVDNLMLGHYDVSAFAASGLGRVWVMGTTLLGHGVLLGLDPIVSQAYGARDVGRMGSALQRGLLLSLLLSLPIGALWLFTEPVLVFFGQKPELAALAHRYALAQLPGLPFFLGFMALRSWLQSRRLMRPAMWTVLFANGLNAAVNALLIFGLGPFPELGLVGAGIATSLTQIAMFLFLAWSVRAFRLHRGAWAGWRAPSELRRGLGEVVGFGFPVALQLGLEMWAFQIATLWAGQLGEVPLASHQIALNLASLSFMVPLGVAIGASTRVGNLIGARRVEDALRAAWASLGLGAAAMLVFALVFVLTRDSLPRLFTPELEVVALASAVLPIAAAFQLFDGLQVVGGGILRGMGRTRPAAAIHLVAFYVVGLPLAHVLGFGRGLGLAGLWWGLAAGLAGAAVALVAWIARAGRAARVGA